MATTKKNVRAVLHGPEKLVIEENEIGLPGPGEAQVSIQATGLCGSDLHYYLHARNGSFVHEKPAVLGHEAAGIVTAVGDGVRNVKVGDRVAVEAGIQCGFCRYCKAGKYNLCPDMRYCSSAKSNPILDGTLQSFINHPARLLHPMPPNVTYELASLVEPLSVALHASRRAPTAPGHSVLVFGAGPMGILQCAVAKAQGAARVMIVDVDEGRVRFAMREGFATMGYVLERTPRPKSGVEKEKEEGLERAKEVAGVLVGLLGEGEGSDGFDVVYECSGVESCVQTGIYAARPSGKVAIIGMGTTVATLPLAAAAFREVDIVGVMRFCNTYPEALAMFAGDRLPGLDKLVTARYPLSKTKEAFETVKRGKDEQGNMMMKIMVGAY